MTALIMLTLLLSLSGGPVVAEWTAVIAVRVPCPQAESIDPYTGEGRSIVIRTAQLCWGPSRIKPMARVFPTLGEAMRFVDEAPGSWSRTATIDWKITLLKENRWQMKD